MNADLLKGKIKELHMTQADVACGIGISLSRFNAKLNGTGGAEFSLGEIRAMRKLMLLGDDTSNAIFFG